MADIHLNPSANENIRFGGDTSMPKYVGARAVVDRVGNGVRITLTDYKGTTQEIIQGVKGDKGDKGNPGGAFYGTCDSTAGATEKAVTCEEFTADDLKAGTIIIVTFTATNSGAVANLTMNVNGTGAKHIKYINNGSLGNLSLAGYLKANTEYPFYYDGANWVCWFNVNTTYSAMTESEMHTGTATSARTITAQRLKQAVEYHAPKELPTVTTTDEGKFLRVNSSGVWAAEAVASAESEAY